MDNNEARLQMVENLAKVPEITEKQLEALFVNPHFGDVVTEVFPKVLDPHDAYGRKLMKKYSDLATFLEETKGGTGDEEGSVFVTSKLLTKTIGGYHAINPIKGLEALSVRYFRNLRAESFEVVRDEEGMPIGIGVSHPAYVFTTGWAEESIKALLPYSIIETTTRGSLWDVERRELDRPADFVHGKTANEVYGKVMQLDEASHALSQPIGGVVLDMQTEAFRTDAGLDPKQFLPVDQQS